MKKAICASILALCILILTSGCGGEQPAAGGDTASTASTGQARVASTPRQTAAPSSQPAETSSAPANDDPTALPVTDFAPQVAGFTFDLTPDELLQRLEDEGPELKPADYSVLETIKMDEEPVKDGRQYNAANDDYSYTTTNGIQFWYNDEDKMWEIGTSQADVPTAEGLRVGDSLDKMREIYGENYQADIYGYPVHRYYNGSYYLLITHGFDEEADVVTGWCVSLHYDVKND